MNNRKGFTLIELMIVVVIIGILAAIAIPRFQNVSKSSKESEAPPILKQIFVLQERYQAREGAYTLDITQLEGGAALASSGRYYTYSVAAHATGFCIVATPVDASVVDPQSMDGNKVIHASGAC